MAKLLIKLSGQATIAQITASLQYAQSKAHLPSFLKHVGESLGAMSSSSVQIQNDNAVAASGVITIVDNTKVTANDTYKIGSMVLTAKASGATGAQFNIGADATATALNLSRAISANSSGLLGASSALGVVTVRCSVAGVIGNAVAILITQADSGATSDAALSSGSDDTASFVDYRQL